MAARVAGERRRGEVIYDVTKSRGREVADEVLATEHRKSLNVGKIGNGRFSGDDRGGEGGEGGV